MSDRSEFENRNPVPEDAVWSEKKQGYYWSNYPTVAHPFNDDWEVWQEALEYARAQSWQGAEPVGWQFYQDGKWWNGDDRIKDHRKNTEEAGYPVRDVYTAPQPAQQGSVPERIKNRLICALRQFRHNSDNSPDVFNPKEGFVAAYDKDEIDKIIAELTCTPQPQEGSGNE